LEDPTMKLQSATRTTPPGAQRLCRSFCPQCNDMLLAPARSEYVNASLIRHFWSCDACGHEFRTSVNFKTLSARRAGTPLS
jgi:transcription elongation factor Elf1